MAQSEVGAMGGATTMPAASRGGRESSVVRLGWLVLATTVLACVVAALLDRHAERGPRTFVFLVVALTLAGLGALLTTRMPRHRISWVIAGAGLWWGGSLLVSAYAVQALVVAPDPLAGGIAAAWFDSWAWLPGLALFLCLLLVLMPDGHLASRGWWPVPAAVTAGTVVFAFVASTDPTYLLVDTRVENPLAFRNAATDVLGVTGFLLVLGGLVASIVAFAVRYRRCEGIEKQQLRWVGACLALALTLGVIGALTWDLSPVSRVLPALSLLVLTAGIAVAVLRYRLYELDVVVNRAAVYLALTFVVVGTYVVVVGLVGSFVSRRGDFVVSLVVTGLVAICFQPLRERIQRMVNRLMYGERDDPYLAIAGLGRTLASSLQVDAVLPAAVETIGRTLALRYVAVAIEDEPIAEFGIVTDEMLAFPLEHQGAVVGELRLAPRPGERLRPRDRRLVSDLAPQVAAAVHEVELSRELRAARRRLAQLREEERRRIRRDLHDGLGPALAGLTFTLDAVRNLAESDLRRADELLRSATEHVQSMIADVRRLIYELRPPALDELGLVASIRGLVSREVAASTRIEIEAPESLPSLGAAIEVATYRIVQEALTNVARHAGAGSCTVRLSVDPGALKLEVADDGRGFAEHRVGVGLGAMRERAVELGGSCEIVSAPGAGTTIAVRLPREPAVEVVG